jgi:hypothetical protein
MALVNEQKSNGQLIEHPQIWDRGHDDQRDDYTNWEKWVSDQMPDHCEHDWESVDFVVRANLYAIMFSIVSDLAQTSADE